MESKNEVSAEVVFEYTGEGCIVPKEVTIVRFHLSVIEVENEAFKSCNKLRRVVFNVGLKKIGQLAFYSCLSLESITLPSTVIAIGGNTFQYCNKLREVVFNDGLQRIGRQAFYECRSLSSIKLPSTVTEIEDWAFMYCKQLREVELNGGLQKIGKMAFQNCVSLSTITLPSTVTDVDDSVFYNCPNLREVIFHGVPREIGQYAFSNCTLLGRFKCPTISTRLDTLIQTGHWDAIENEVNEVRGVVERSGSDYFVSARTMDGGNNWIRVRESLDKIVRLISYHELKEGTSIFELALWKFKLDQVDKACPFPRKKCRMDVPGPVKDIIRQYLPYECLLPPSDV